MAMAMQAVQAWFLRLGEMARGFRAWGHDRRARGRLWLRIRETVAGGCSRMELGGEGETKEMGEVGRRSAGLLQARRMGSGAPPWQAGGGAHVCAAAGTQLLRGEGRKTTGRWRWAGPVQ